jgi:hypothetical protein
MVFWIALVVSIALLVAFPRWSGVLFTAGSIDVLLNDVLLGLALLLGAQELLRTAGSRNVSYGRFFCRLVIAYLLYEVLVVIPVATLLRGLSVSTVLRAMGVRFDWLLFPVLLTLFRDERMRRGASRVLVAAVALLAAWGAYLAVTGGSASMLGDSPYYYETGEGLRYRILTAPALPLFAWPFAVAASGAVPMMPSVALATLALVGQTLTSFRSGLVALVVSGGVGLVTSKRLMRAALWIVPLGLLAVMALIVWGPAIREVYGYTLGSLLDLGSNTAADRLMRWGLAADFIRSHPFNDYVWSWRFYPINLRGAYGPHNALLEIGATEGVAGIVFYVTILLRLVSSSVRNLWTDVETRTVVCFLIAYLVFASANTTWYATASMPLLVAALAALVARLDEIRHADVQSERAMPDGSMAL